MDGLPQELKENIEASLKVSIDKYTLIAASDPRTIIARLVLSDGRVVRLASHPVDSRERVYEIMKLLWSDFSTGQIHIPEPITYLKSDNALLYTEARGQSLRVYFDNEDTPKAIFLVGQALRKLHNIPSPSFLPVWSLDAYFAPLLKRIKSEVKVDIVERLQTLQNKLGTSNASALIHGDPWPENFIIDKTIKIVTIIDFTDTSLGDPAFDLGFFQMHCITAPARASWKDALWQGYGLVNDIFMNRVYQWTAINLLHNALYLETWLNPDNLPSRHPLVNKRIEQADKAAKGEI